uniref:Tubulin--tyrosine ligase-like protein 5 n=1 Tax=Trepomonas sp. PC1 TaxID=1076344 RepID=A0A146KCX3_9EUKA|eukprot:JAP93525.1 Tubulin tyrosine ligase [Trepomonas sp. PC1]
MSFKNTIVPNDSSVYVIKKYLEPDYYEIAPQPKLYHNRWLPRMSKQLKPAYEDDFDWVQGKQWDDCYAPFTKKNCKNDIQDIDFDVMSAIIPLCCGDWLKKIKPNQYVNMLPTTKILYQKYQLGRAISDYSQKRPDVQPAQPKSYEANSKELIDLFKNGGHVICKQSGGYGSHGTIITNEMKKVRSKGYVIQKFEEDILMYKGHRFENRQFFIVTNLDPLIAYTHPSGFSRFQKHKYEGIKSKLMDNIQAPMNDAYGLDQNKWITDGGFKANISSRHLMKLIDEDEQNFNAINRINSSYIAQQQDYLVSRILTQTIDKMLVNYDEQYKTYPKRFFQLFGIDQFFLRNGSSQAYEVNGKSSLIEANVNLDQSLNYVDIYPQMLNLIGIRRIDEPIEQIPIKYSMDIEELRKIMNQNKRINLTTLTQYEQRCYWQILDEETRLGEFRRIKFENTMDEFIEPSYLTQLVYYLKKLGVTSKNKRLTYAQKKKSNDII